MGENYYLRYDACPTCGHFRNELHIGKASAGWRFLFQAYPEQGINSVKNWKDNLKLGTIFNEYEEAVTEEEFWDVVKYHENEQAHDPKSDYTYVSEDGYDFSDNDFS